MSKFQPPSKIVYTNLDMQRRCIESSDDLGYDAEARSPFERDRSRIIHSAAFRRLQGKTQVFTAGEGDFYRTRLTHSLEVAQIGKGLALRLGADTDLVEAACLVHDIGHPPFGHAGEQELQRLMKKYGGFEANAQNIRLLTEKERKSTKYQGLNLTRATIDSQLKYKQPYPERTDKFIYSDDLGIVSWAGRKNAQSFECQIMDWADEVAYAVHDLEDGLHSRYIDAFTFADPDTRLQEAIEYTAKKWGKPINYVRALYVNLQRELLQWNPYLRPKRTAKDLAKQSEYRKEMTTELIGRFVTAARRVQTPLAGNDLITQRYWFSLNVPDHHRVEVSLINRIVRNFVIKAPQLATLEAKGKQIIRALFIKLMRDEHLLPEDWQPNLANNANKEHKARVVSDYISGMTDDYAQNLYAKLLLPHYGSVYEVI